MISVTINPKAFNEQSIADAVRRARKRDRSEIKRLQGVILELDQLNKQKLCQKKS